MAARESGHAPEVVRLDLAAHRRSEPGLIEHLRRDERTRVLPLVEDLAPVVGASLCTVAPDAAASAEHWAFIGQDATGRAILAAVLEHRPAIAGEDAEWLPLMVAGGVLDGHDADVLVTSLALTRWLREAPHCPACGARCDVADAGWSRRCPSCSRQHFPRTDPAVIVAVTDAAGERLLLGANAAWRGDRYSCFAGFVEAGESLEAAVVREVAEEAGVVVRDPRYVGSQPWPYPRSLMLGFEAIAHDAGLARADGEEIVDVRWFTRREIGDALAGSGEVLLPGPASIAHRLIREWSMRG